MIIALDILAVDPAYQRRGAGRLLVKWGTAIADELGYAVCRICRPEHRLDPALIDNCS